MKRPSTTFSLAIMLLACGFTGFTIATAPAWADEIRQERVQFARGATSATIKDRIKGRETIDYTLSARAGQNMVVELETKNSANAFNILAPGETEVAFFIGSNEGNRFQGRLPATGDYTIRVYLDRAAARRGETANYQLKVAIGAGQVGTSGNGGKSAAQRAGEGDFDATGRIPCAQAGQPMGQCDFGVAREGGGTAAVVVTRPDGRKRALFFVNGAFNSADTSQADGYPEYSDTREGDLNMIRVGNERYEIPDAVIHGG